jgi:hypothetical protein
MGSRSSELYSIYFKARGIQPEFVTPPPGDEALPGASADTLLAYYSVRSGRLTNNPAGVRIALATAETLLEAAGANAGYFISNPATRTVVETLVERFTSESLEDAGFELIGKRFLIAAVAAATEAPGLTQGMPALKPLLGALADVSAESGGGRNLVAGIVSAGGFTRLLTGYLTRVAADPSFLTKDALVQKALAAGLNGLVAKLPRIAEEPGVLSGVIEAALGEAIRHVPALLEGKIGGNPLLATVLSTLAGEVSNSTEPFFKRLSPVNLLPAIYKTALQKIAADPALVTGAGGESAVLRELVRNVAAAVAELEPANVFSEESLRTLAAMGIEALGNHPELLAGNEAAATQTLGLVFRTGAAALKDLRLDREELIALAGAALETAAAHPAVAKADPAFAAVLPVISKALLDSDLKSLLTGESWRAAVLAGLNAVVSNPAVWKEFRDRDIVQPLAGAIVAALSGGNALLLTGPSFAATLQTVLTLAARRGSLLLEDTVSPADLGAVIAAAIAAAGSGGAAVDAGTLPLFLERIMASYLKHPFATNDAARLRAFIDDAVALIDNL